MTTKTNLSHVKPCNQIWEDMSICAGGRMCSKCDNVIHDLRGLSDWDIAVIHASSEKKVCGIYDKDRLKIKSKREVKKRHKFGLLFTGFASLLSTNAIAAEVVIPNSQAPMIENIRGTQIEVTKKKSSTQQERVQSQNDSLKIIRGIVLDESGEALVGVNILIKGTYKGTITDVDGSYSLEVTEELKENDSVVLIYSYTGYGRKEYEILSTELDDRVELQVMMQIDYDVMMTSFGVGRAPLHKRIWKGITGIFKKKH